MLCRNVLVVILIVCPASFSASQGGTFQGPNATIQYSPSTAAGLNPASLVMELDRAIRVLKRGLRQQWQNRDQYLSAFAKTPSTDPTGLSVADAKKYVECAMSTHLRIHQIWDEGVPIENEAGRTIIEFRELRSAAVQATTAEQRPSVPYSQGAVFHPPSCPGFASQKVTVTAGVAAGLLKTRVDPVYPAEALVKHVSGTVVLRARISTKGRVEALRVMSGPALLQDPALHAVRQWTYSPYLLNNIPVEVETTIDVTFHPGS